MKIFTQKEFNSPEEIENFFHKLFACDKFEIISITYATGENVNPYKVFFYLK